MSRKMNFAVVSPYKVTTATPSKETYNKRKDIVEWGDNNSFPDFLLELVKEVPTLSSIIEGSVDFTLGDAVRLNRTTDDDGKINKKGETITDLVELLARDLFRYNGFAIQVIRNRIGEVAELYHIDLRYLRTNKDCNVFYYCEDWSRTKEVLTYPSFMEKGEAYANSIFYYKGSSEGVYPLPLYYSAIRSCEIERDISIFHRTSLNNGFAPSAIINFNNGEPTEDVKNKIERALYNKFGGVENAGAMMCIWNESKESEATITTLTTEDFGERYQALAAYSRQQIFTAFRANGNLFGIPTDGKGFAEEQYAESFKLYNRTHIRPMQRRIADAMEKIYGIQGVLEITPFNLDEEKEDVVQ